MPMFTLFEGPTMTESDIAALILQNGACADCAALVTTAEEAEAHASPAGFACDEHRVRTRLKERDCGGCAYLSEDGFLCDHYAKADAENDEVGVRDPNASNASVALGHQIVAWSDSDEDSGCPGFEGVS